MKKKAVKKGKPKKPDNKLTPKQERLSDLIPDDRNYNKGNEKGRELIKKSISKLGAGRSILIDKNNRIIAGNKTVENAIASGLVELQIVETTGNKIIAVKRTDIDLDSKKGRELALADNATAKANIEWDSDALNEDWSKEELSDWGVVTGFEIEAEAEEDDYEIPDTIETDIVLGDLFEIGRHRLLCGDSTQTDTFEKLFDGAMADLVVTDPPYNVAYKGKTKDALEIESDGQSDGDFYQFLYDFYTALGAFTKQGGAWYIWQSDKQIHRFVMAFENSGFKFSGLNIWVKNSLVMSRGDYHSKHETCIYGWKEGAAHKWYSDRKQTTVLNFDRPNRNAEHPTMKPIPLFGYQIGNSSKQGDIVADGFGGSGTTMVACHQMDRKAYLVEFDPKYCQVIIDRMIKLAPSLEIKRNGKKYINPQKTAN